MSHYDWERGGFKLSVKEYGKFKREFRNRWNASLDEAYANALKIHAGVLAKFKGKRNVDWWSAVRDFEVRSTGGGWIGGIHVRPTTETLLDLPHWEKIQKALGFTHDRRGMRPVRPKKKDFPKITNKTVRFDIDDASVSFDDRRRVVVWCVHENNNACERERGAFMGRLFFELLNKVEWTRGTGGELIGNDEYNRDSDGLGGGGNYLKAEYGPKQQKEQRAREARRTVSYW